MTEELDKTIVESPDRPPANAAQEADEEGLALPFSPGEAGQSAEGAFPAEVAGSPTEMAPCAELGAAASPEAEAPAEAALAEPPPAPGPGPEQAAAVQQEVASGPAVAAEAADQTLAGEEATGAQAGVEGAEAAGAPPSEQAPSEAGVEAPPQPLPPAPKSDKMDWYILKVQSNREEAIREGLSRRIAIAGLDRYFGDIIIPTEKVTEFKGGKRKVSKRKLYPGYLVVQMEINEDTWFLVRETPGIGDFTGAAGHPTPMHPREVAAILAKQEEKADEAPKLKINFRVGDHVKIKEGTFENFEGDVASIDETNGRVTVLINIFGRSTPVDIEYWQIEAV
ncbi:MAG: transcription termination/antitermination protein NusG [Thermoguttaceae bacterium]